MVVLVMQDNCQNFGKETAVRGFCKETRQIFFFFSIVDRITTDWVGHTQHFEKRPQFGWMDLHTWDSNMISYRCAHALHTHTVLNNASFSCRHLRQESDRIPRGDAASDGNEPAEKRATAWQKNDQLCNGVWWEDQEGLQH